jgi:hypothetical protein
VGADAEGQVLTRLAVDVENVSVRRELTVIPVGGAPINIIITPPSGTVCP